MSDQYFDKKKLVRVTDLFASLQDKEFYKRLGFWGYSRRAKEKMSAILNAFMELVLDDIIDNNVSFRMPTARETYLELRQVGSEEFKHYRFRNMYPGSDPLKMNFHCVEMVLRYYDKRKHEWNCIDVIVGPKHKKRILENIYAGKY